MPDYHDPQTLLEALRSLDVLWKERKPEEHVDLRDEIEAQWAGFRIGYSDALGMYGLFPEVEKKEPSPLYYPDEHDAACEEMEEDNFSMRQKSLPMWRPRNDEIHDVEDLTLDYLDEENG